MPAHIVKASLGRKVSITSGPDRILRESMCQQDLPRERWTQALPPETVPPGRQVEALTGGRWTKALPPETTPPGRQVEALTGGRWTNTPPPETTPPVPPMPPDPHSQIAVCDNVLGRLHNGPGRHSCIHSTRTSWPGAASIWRGSPLSPGRPCSTGSAGRWLRSRTPGYSGSSARMSPPGSTPPPMRRLRTAFPPQQFQHPGQQRIQSLQHRQPLQPHRYHQPVQPLDRV